MNPPIASKVVFLALKGFLFVTEFCWTHHIALFCGLVLFFKALTKKVCDEKAVSKINI